MKPLRLAQISDFHFTKMNWNPLRLFPKRVIGNLNWVLNRKNSLSTKPLEALPSFLEQFHLDRVLLGGDFTTTSLPSEFAMAVDFAQKLPAPWIAIPGNHDRYTYASCRQKRVYRAFKNEPVVSNHTLSKDRVEVHQLAPGWSLIALDTARARLTDASGLFSEAQEAALRDILSRIPPEERILVFNHYPFFQNDVPQHCLERGSALEALLRSDPRIKAYLHGHTHRHTIADLQPSGLPLILDSGCAAHLDRGSWNLLEINDQGIRIDVYRWIKDAWALSRTEKIAWTR